jgi:hypothetical protein
MSQHRAPVTAVQYLRPRLIFAGLLLGILFAASQTAGLI